MADTHVVNTQTKEIIERSFTPEEQATHEAAQADAAPSIAALVAAKVESDAAGMDLRDQYTAAVNRLDQIRTQTLSTNALRDSAIKDMALILKRMLRLIKSQIG